MDNNNTIATRVHDAKVLNYMLYKEIMHKVYKLSIMEIPSFSTISMCEITNAINKYYHEDYVYNTPIYIYKKYKVDNDFVLHNYKCVLRDYYKEKMRGNRELRAMVDMERQEVFSSRDIINLYRTADDDWIYLLGFACIYKYTDKPYELIKKCMHQANISQCSFNKNICEIMCIHIPIISPYENVTRCFACKTKYQLNCNIEYKCPSCDHLVPGYSRYKHNGCEIYMIGKDNTKLFDMKIKKEVDKIKEV